MQTPLLPATSTASVAHLVGRDCNGSAREREVEKRDVCGALHVARLCSRIRFEGGTHTEWGEGIGFLLIPRIFGLSFLL